MIQRCFESEVVESAPEMDMDSGIVAKKVCQIIISWQLDIFIKNMLDFNKFM